MTPPNAPGQPGDLSAQSPPGVERLAARHDVSRFACGEADLDAYIRERATEDERRRGAAAYVMVDPNEPSLVLGYYTLSMFYFRRSAATKADQRRLPRYAEIPAVLIGRLALDSSVSGRGLGAALLYEAIERVQAVTASIPAAVIVVHALHEHAARFYEHHGFIRFADEPLHLYVSLAAFSTARV